MNRVKHLSTYLECSSGCAPTVDSIKKFIDYISAFGYDEFYIGLTDAYKIEEYPYFNYHRGSYSKKELLEIESYAKVRGVKVIPAIQVLGHLEFIWRHESFRPFMDTRSILEVGNPQSYALVEAMMKSMSESFLGRTIHVGMDETFGLGLGKYLEEHGLVDKKRLLLEYLKEVVKIAKKYGFEIEIWGDMLLDSKCTEISTADIKKELPEGTLVWQWDYESVDKALINKKIEEMEEHAERIGFAGCAWKHTGYVANNDYSLPRLVSQIEAVGKYGIDKYMVTVWGDFGIPASIFSVLPSLYVAAEANCGRPTSSRELDKKRFEDIVGISYDDLLSLDLLNNPYRHDRRKHHNNTSYIAFYSDLLLGNYDLYASKGVNARYRALSSKYNRIAKASDNPYFSSYFAMVSLYAKILSKKIHLSSEIKEAYYAADKDKLRSLLPSIDSLIKLYRKFDENFDKYFLNENQAFGLEIEQLHHAHMLKRAIYLKERVLSFIEKGTPIGEFLERARRSDYNPQPNEDCYIDNNFEWLITYNTSR